MKSVVALVVVILICAFTYLAGEGLYAVARPDRGDQTVAYKTYQLLFGVSARQANMQSLDPGVVVSERQFEELMDQFVAHDVGLGNTPYNKLKTDRSAINYTEDGCMYQKPNQDKAIVRLRTMLFNPFDPVLAFYDWGKPLSPDLQEFFETYHVSYSRLRSNEWGERLTDPYVERPDKVLVAGDSRANGSGVNDGDTISSQLQRLDDSVQYINLGVAGAEGKDIVCILKRAGDRYAGQIRQLIYVYCENDFDASIEFGTPEEIVAWVRDFAAAQNITKVLFVYAPTIYNIAPEVTRMRGYRGWRMETHTDEKRRLRTLVAEGGFGWFDFTELGREKVEEEHSIFAGLSLFVDQGHFSPEGARRLAERILRLGS